ncbi:FmdE family protein [Methanospirillum hungatei]|uniref:FmdE family protein n=1 Tax=Methanospirillum hungatei TaxID=2203 RepID=UPI0026EAA1AC|nr:FmdE family protein [Methanospirillum hungatei]MCA1917675.1 FmdE family protein [Methanospirillum hungatei]
MCISSSAGEPVQGTYGSYEQAVEFHGHSCGGLASGYRVAIAAMKALGVERPKDEELVAIADTDACGVDAVQVITGCTAGKGNLIINDYGKHAFTFYCRRSNKAVRVVTSLDGFLPEEMNALRPKVFSGQATEEEKARYQELAHQGVHAILTAPEEKILKIQFVDMQPPRKARIFQSIPCECCGEMVADAKTREHDGKRVCIPCYLSATNS